jgi:hypothetical protein
MSKSSTLTSWNNFGPWEGSVFEFRSLSRVQNLEIQSARPSPPMSGPKRASTGAIDTRSHSRPPQSRSPSGDHAHSREGTGAGHRRSSLTHMGAPVLSGRGQLKGGVLDPFHFLLTSSRLPSPLLTIAGHPHSPRRHPSRGRGSPSSPLPLSPGFGLSRQPTTPRNAVHRTAVSFLTGDRRPPCSVSLRLGYYF